MKNTILLALLVIAALATPTYAALIPCFTGNYADYRNMTLAGDECFFGDKVFYNFDYLSANVLPGSVATQPITDLAGNYGIQINPGMTAGPGQTLDFLFSFAVRTLSGEATITSIHLDFNGAYGAGDGVARVDEQYCLNADVVQGCQETNMLSVINTAGLQINHESATFAAVTHLAVSKDVLVSGGTSGLPAISRVDNTFDQGIPEPATFGLIGLALLALPLRKRFARP